MDRFYVYIGLIIIQFIVLYYHEKTYKEQIRFHSRGENEIDFELLGKLKNIINNEGQVFSRDIDLFGKDIMEWTEQNNTPTREYFRHNYDFYNNMFNAFSAKIDYWDSYLNNMGYAYLVNNRERILKVKTDFINSLSKKLSDIKQKYWEITDLAFMMKELSEDD